MDQEQQQNQPTEQQPGQPAETTPGSGMSKTTIWIVVFAVVIIAAVIVWVLIG